MKKLLIFLEQIVRDSWNDISENRRYKPYMHSPDLLRNAVVCASNSFQQYPEKGYHRTASKNIASS